MYSIRSLLTILVLITGTSFSLAQNRATRLSIPWTQGDRFDFCPDRKEFDYRNAYWLAAMSYYSYWQPYHLEQVITAPFGKPFNLKLKGPDDSPNGTTEVYGLGWKGHMDFFTSSTLRPHSPKKYNDHHVSYFTAPLPYESCVKKEKLWCFGGPTGHKRSQMEINECGQNLELALMTRERLRAVHEMMRGIEIDPQVRSQALVDKKIIEHYVRAYEQKKQVDLGLDFQDPRFEERCDIYRVDQDFTPDVQALWMESSDLVIVAFRGTEQDNIIDWTTDLATSFQLNHKYLPFWKRNVHKGYEQSLEIMSDWLQNEVNQLFKRYPHASTIPIFLTGHSMGGALATLVMTSLLERNQKIAPDLRLNLKAVYTFGSPRIGNLNFARSFEALNKEEQVGVYRLVNNKDVVTRAPCLDYFHFGTNIQLLTPEHRPSPTTSVEVLVNPSSKEYNYCAWGPSILDNIINIKTYTRDHYLKSYFSILRQTKAELQRAFHLEEADYFNETGKAPEENPYRFPNNCNEVPIKSKNVPDYLKYNYEALPFEIEAT